MVEQAEHEDFGVAIVGGRFPGTPESRQELVEALAARLAGEDVRDPRYAYASQRTIRVRWEIAQVIGPKDGWIWFILTR